ncbi:MAG: transglycosylase domain-containing protein, partial [Bacteroidia bacterium]|nr:transglycosylase domain-containing protein [Bacteroidia bacterium]
MSEKNKSNYRKIILFLWLTLAVGGLGSIWFINAIDNGTFGELPSFEELENPKSFVASEVYSADDVLFGKYYVQNRSNIKYEELSPNIVNALIATEDIRYFDHSGIDLKGLFRVFFKTILLRQKAGGGSTITQQLAKNLFPRQRFDNPFDIIVTKIKEWITAIKLERNYTKNEVLTMYFNTVEFGGNSFGIKSAAKTFFDTTPGDLKIQEAAVLVGVLKGTTLYSPRRNPERALKRRNIVLSQMRRNEFISDSLYDTLRKLPIKLYYQVEDHNQGLAPYFREILREKLHHWCKNNAKADGTPYDLYRDGLKIYTTIDSRMQQYAENAVKEHLTELQEEFFKHWKGKEPWGPHKEVIELAYKRSKRYKNLKAKGVSADSIRKVFAKPIKMKIFTWKGEVDTVMSPLDSIKYHKHFLLTGMMSMEPQTGHVKAWVGGINHKFFKYDHVFRGRRQVGSTFKPFLYTVAIDNKISPCSKVP